MSRVRKYSQNAAVVGLTLVSVTADFDFYRALFGVFRGWYRAKEDLHIFTNDKQQFLEQSYVDKSKSSTLDYGQPSRAKRPAVGLGLGLAVAPT